MKNYIINGVELIYNNTSRGLFISNWGDIFITELKDEFILNRIHLKDFKFRI